MSLLPGEWRPLLLHLLFHAAAAAVVFVFLVVLIMGGLFIVMPPLKDDGDPGGPLFLPILLLGLTILAGVVAAFSAIAVLLSAFMRRFCDLPLWLPPLGVFLLATGAAFVCLLCLATDPAFASLAGLSLMVGLAVALVFVFHWAAVSTIWFLLRKLERRVGTAGTAHLSSGDGGKVGNPHPTNCESSPG